MTPTPAIADVEPRGAVAKCIEDGTDENCSGFNREPNIVFTLSGPAKIETGADLVSLTASACQSNYRNEDQIVNALAALGWEPASIASMPTDEREVLAALVTGMDSFQPPQVPAHKTRFVRHFRRNTDMLKLQAALLATPEEIPPLTVIECGLSLASQPSRRMVRDLFHSLAQTMGTPPINANISWNSRSDTGDYLGFTLITHDSENANQPTSGMLLLQFVGFPQGE